MLKSELIAKLNELLGNNDVEIYLDTRGEHSFTGNFKVILDGDGDILIQS